MLSDILNPRSEGRVGIISLNWLKKFDNYARKKFDLEGEEISGLTSQNYQLDMMRKSSVSNGDYGGISSKIAPSTLKDKAKRDNKIDASF